jgi:DNA (cytosine-5)-methyltransferase 1
VYDTEGISPTLSKMDGGGREPHIAQPIILDKNVGGEEREIANRITSREDRGVANTKQTGTAVAIPIGGMKPFNSERFGNGCICEGNSYTLRADKHDASVALAIPVLTPDRAEKRQNGRRFKEDGEPMFTLTGQDRHGVGIEIEQIDIVQTVKVRKYEVDKETLIACLRNAKEKASLNNKTIAEELDLPVTKVEHWFRNDGSFAVPDADIWSDLKQLLKIETDEFDESILTFDEKLNEYDKSNRCYKATGISPTLTSASANEKIAIEVSDKKIAAIWSDKYKCYIAIRKLTPKECFRLQGWTDDYFEKAEFVNSNSQLYKQAGNGVTVNVIYEIAKKL